jgi:hypothetical protein
MKTGILSSEASASSRQAFKYFNGRNLTEEIHLAKEKT